MQLKPIGDKVFVEIDKQQRETPSGLILLEDEMHIPTSGIVFAVGEGKYHGKKGFIPTTAKVGERVYFRRRLGKEVEIDGKEYYVLNESEDILGIERG